MIFAVSLWRTSLFALALVCTGGKAIADDESDLSLVDPSEDDFSLNAPDDSNVSNTKSGDPTKEAVSDFGSESNNEKLNFGDDKPRSKNDDVNETVGLDLKEAKKNDTPEVILRDATKEAAKPTNNKSEQAGDTQQNATIPQAPPATNSLSAEQPVSDAAPAAATAAPETPPPPQELITENDFAGTPFVKGGRRAMALGEAPEYYKVEHGDTLFDICDQLIDEPKYWPKLWALNPGIKNPHFIFPGMTLSFYPGDDATPPYLQVVSEDEVLPIETGGLREIDLVAQPTDEIAEETTSDIPASLTDKFIEVPHGMDGVNTDFEYFGNVYQPNLAQLVIPAFFFEDEVEPLGAVIAGPKGEVHVQENDDVIIEVEDGGMSVGSMYTVLRPSGKARNGDGDSIGYRYEYIAQIKVSEKTDDDDAVLAKVVKSRLGIKPEDLIVAFKSTARSYTTDTGGPGSEAAEASVVGFEYPDQTIGGQGGIVFVDKQFSPGVSIPIYQRMDQRLPSLLKTGSPSVTSRVGYIRIIDTVGSASVGVVTRNVLDIRLGDKLGKG